MNNTLPPPGTFAKKYVGSQSLLSAALGLAEPFSQANLEKVALFGPLSEVKHAIGRMNLLSKTRLFYRLLDGGLTPRKRAVMTDLIKAGVSVSNGINKPDTGEPINGYTPLEYALYRVRDTDWKLVDFLLENGADPTKFIRGAGYEEVDNYPLTLITDHYIGQRDLTKVQKYEKLDTMINNIEDAKLKDRLQDILYENENISEFVSDLRSVLYAYASGENLNINSDENSNSNSNHSGGYRRRTMKRSKKARKTRCRRV